MVFVQGLSVRHFELHVQAPGRAGLHNPEYWLRRDRDFGSTALSRRRFRDAEGRSGRGAGGPSDDEAGQLLDKGI